MFILMKWKCSCQIQDAAKNLQNSNTEQVEIWEHFKSVEDLF